MVKSIPNSSGFLIVSIGLFFLVTANFYDSAGHWFGIPESFFSPAHAAVYVGVAITIFGSIWILMRSGFYLSRMNKSENKEHSPKSNLKTNVGLSRRFSNSEMLSLSIKMIFYGIIILVLAGPFDFAWHAAFGLDGLLSPPHAVFRAGQGVCGIGALLGIVAINRGRESQSRNKTNSWLYPISIIITVAGLWAGFVRCINMVTLPFSNTGYFDWNPNPIVAALIATIAFPFFNSLMLYCSFRLGNLHNQRFSRNKEALAKEIDFHPKFGILTMTAVAYVGIITFTIIASNKYLLSTAPFYILNVIPILIIDILLTKLYSKSVRSTRKRIGEIIAGAVLGLLFLSLHYPYITFTYNEILEIPEYITSKNIVTTYIKVVQELPWLSFPAIASGIIGMMMGARLFSPHRSKRRIKLE